MLQLVYIDKIVSKVAIKELIYFKCYKNCYKVTNAYVICSERKVSCFNDKQTEFSWTSEKVSSAKWST